MPGKKRRRLAGKNTASGSRENEMKTQKSKVRETLGKSCGLKEGKWSAHGL